MHAGVLHILVFGDCLGPLTVTQLASTGRMDGAEHTPKDADDENDKGSYSSCENYNSNPQTLF